MSDVMELAARDPNALRLRDKIDVLRQTVAKGASDAQFEMFMTLAERYQLDPFLKEIWFVPEVGIVTARDGYLKIAMRDPDYDGIVSAAVREGDEFSMEPLTPTIKHRFGMKRGAVIGAYAVVFHKGRRPVVCYADMNEYRKGGNVWGKYQSAMIQKVAEVMALKRQFGITGLVTEEELGPLNATQAVSGIATDSVIDAAFNTPDPPADLESIQAEMKDRSSIGKALGKLLQHLSDRIGEEPARAEFDRLLVRHGADKWESLSSIKLAKQFAADLYALVQNAQFASAPEPIEVLDE